MSIVTYENVDTPVFEIDYLRYLFANGEAGLWLPYRPDRLYADVANTVPAAFGGGIASFDDLSGNGVTGPQSVSTARPIMGRVPRTGQRNLLTWTEDLSNPAWVKNLTFSEEGIVAPDGVSTAYKVIEGDITPINGHGITQVIGSTTENYRISVYAKAAERSILMIERGYGGSNKDTAIFDLSSGTVLRDIPRVAPVEIEHVGDGWYRCSCRMIVAGDSLRSCFRILQGWTPGDPESPSETTYEGDGVSGLYLWGAQVELTPNYTTPYQRVGNAYDITEAGVPSVRYAHYDLADDVLPQDATLPAITDGTVILIGQQGIWIDEGYSFAGGNWSFGPTGYTDGPDGIIGVVGDMLDLVVLDRQLTADERDRVVAYGVKRGSAGQIVLGPEVVVNGTFDTDTGWTKGEGWQIGGGVAYQDGSSTGSSYLTTTTPVDGDSYYLLSFEYSSVSGRVRVNPVLGITTPNIASGSSGKYTAVLFNSLSTGTRSLSMQSLDAGADLSVDNISLRKLILPGDTP